MILLNDKLVDFREFPNKELRLKVSDILVKDNRMANVYFKYEEDFEELNETIENLKSYINYLENKLTSNNINFHKRKRF